MRDPPEYYKVKTTAKALENRVETYEQSLGWDTLQSAVWIVYGSVRVCLGSSDCRSRPFDMVSGKSAFMSRVLRLASSRRYHGVSESKQSKLA